MNKKEYYQQIKAYLKEYSGETSLSVSQLFFLLAAAVKYKTWRKQSTMVIWFIKNNATVLTRERLTDYIKNKLQKKAENLIEEYKHYFYRLTGYEDEYYDLADIFFQIIQIRECLHYLTLQFDTKYALTGFLDKKLPELELFSRTADAIRIYSRFQPSSLPFYTYFKKIVPELPVTNIECLKYNISLDEEINPCPEYETSLTNAVTEKLNTSAMAELNRHIQECDKCFAAYYKLTLFNREQQIPELDNRKIASLINEVFKKKPADRVTVKKITDTTKESLERILKKIADVMNIYLDYTIEPALAADDTVLRLNLPEIVQLDKNNKFELNLYIERNLIKCDIYFNRTLRNIRIKINNKTVTKFAIRKKNDLITVTIQKLKKMKKDNDFLFSFQLSAVDYEYNKNFKIIWK